MKEMTKGSPLRLILTFAFPLLLGNVLQQLYNVADAAIVGRFLGPDALAAVGATSSVQFLILGFCIGTCSGFCVPVAQKFGARNYKGMRILLYNSIVLTGIIAAGFTTNCRTALFHTGAIRQPQWSQSSATGRIQNPIRVKTARHLGCAVGSCCSTITLNSR